MGDYTQRSGSLRENMQNMTRLEQVGYIWDLYKLPILIGAVLLVMLVAFLVTLANPDPETLFMGASVNLTVSDEGKTYLTEDIFEMMDGTDPEKQRVDLVYRYLPDAEKDPRLADTERMAMIAMVSTKLLDYMLLDEEALKQYRDSGMIGPVDKVLTAEQLLAFSGKLLPVTAEDGSEYLGVVDITDTAFARDCITGSGKVYIAFPGNTVRADRLDTFLDWLLAWEG